MIIFVLCHSILYVSYDTMGQNKMIKFFIHESPNPYEHVAHVLGIYMQCLEGKT